MGIIQDIVDISIDWWESTFNSIALLFLDVVNHVALLKGTDHRVLFQNAEGTINVGVCFDDPDLEMSDIFWYNQLSKKMHVSLLSNDGLVSRDAESGTLSCYVELHRIDRNFHYVT